MKINKKKLYYLIPITIGKSVSNFIIAIGTVVSFLLYAIFNALIPPLHMDEYLKQIMRIGWASLPVVGLTACFTGGALALQIAEEAEAARLEAERLAAEEQARLEAEAAAEAERQRLEAVLQAFSEFMTTAVAEADRASEAAQNALRAADLTQAARNALDVASAIAQEAIATEQALIAETAR